MRSTPTTRDQSDVLVAGGPPSGTHPGPVDGVRWEQATTAAAPATNGGDSLVGLQRYHARYHIATICHGRMRTMPSTKGGGIWRWITDYVSPVAAVLAVLEPLSPPRPQEPPLRGSTRPSTRFGSTP